MKHYIVILLIALISCATSDDPEPTTFDSLVGDWTFKDGGASATISIAEFSGEEVVDNVGQFTINNASYDITEKYKVAFGTVPGTIQFFHLVNNSNTSMTLYAGDINSAYTEIKFNEYHHSISGSLTVIEREVVLTRK